MPSPTLRFKVDENLPVEVADDLRAAGHDAATVFEQRMIGSDDSNLASVCNAEARALVTADLDFADIRTYPPSSFPGILVFRLANSDKRSILVTLARLLPRLKSEAVAGALWIIDEHSIRIRTSSP